MFGFPKLHDGVKLGKKLPKHDPRTLQLADYTKNMVAAPVRVFKKTPQVCGYSQKLTNLGMMLNDIYGDCTIAAAAHMVQTWTAVNGAQVIPTNTQVLDAYEAACGYVFNNPSTDNGGVLLDVLNYWRTKGLFSDGAAVLGLPLKNTGITAFAQVRPSIAEEVRRSIFYFGGAYIGLQLPLSAQNQDVWDVPVYGARFNGKPGSWGGHAVCLVDYSEQGLYCVTWGAIKLMTWKFLARYCDEAYAIVSPDWFKDGRCPSGFAQQALLNDLAHVTEA